VRVEQESFDGKNHLWLALEGDARETVPTLSGSIVTVRRPAGGPVRLTVRVTTDAPALVPLGRAEIFNEDFQRFAAQVRADTAHPLTSRRLEREVRGVELLCYREKLMAGLPNFATYFGRDMLMTALLMQPVWAPAMSEHVVASALGKLSPAGDVSHRQALGGPPIRARAAEYHRRAAAGQLAGQPGGVRRGPVRDGRERHLGAARARGGRDHSRCAQGAWAGARDSRGTAGRVGARSPGARSRHRGMAGRRASLQGGTQGCRHSRRGKGAVAAAGRSGGLGCRDPTDGITGRFPAVSRPSPGYGLAADPRRSP